MRPGVTRRPRASTTSSPRAATRPSASRTSRSAEGPSAGSTTVPPWISIAGPDVRREGGGALLHVSWRAREATAEARRSQREGNGREGNGWGSGAGARDPTDHEIVEGRHRVSLGPEPYPARPEPAVAVVEPERTVEVALDVVADGDHANRVPLPEGRRLHPHAGDLPAPPIVGVEVEVVLERVGPDDVVLAVVEPEHDPAGRVLPARHGLELHRRVDVRVRPDRGDDHVEDVLHRALDEHVPAARRPRHLLDGPRAVHGLPVAQAPVLEVVAHGHRGGRYPQLGGGRRGAHDSERRQGDRAPLAAPPALTVHPGSGLVEVLGDRLPVVALV